MKLKVILLITIVFFISCHYDRNTIGPEKKVSTLSSDILLQSSAVKPFSRTSKNDYLYLTLSGKTILESRVTFQVIDGKGVEVYCESFEVEKLIQPEYKTANSTLKIDHIRDVVDGFFVDDLDFQQIKRHSLAKL